MECRLSIAFKVNFLWKFGYRKLTFHIECRHSMKFNFQCDIYTVYKIFKFAQLYFTVHVPQIEFIVD